MASLKTKCPDCGGKLDVSRPDIETRDMHVHVTCPKCRKDVSIRVETLLRSAELQER